MAECTCTTGAGGLTDPCCPIHGVASQGDDMNETERAKLRAEVEAGYLKRINHQMSDEEFEVYSQKDRLLFALDKADFRNEVA